MTTYEDDIVRRPVPAHDWCEDDGGDKDTAEDEAGLGDGDSLGQGLAGVEGGEERHGHAGHQVGEAHEEEVEDIPGLHRDNLWEEGAGHLLVNFLWSVRY